MHPGHRENLPGTKWYSLHFEFEAGHSSLIAPQNFLVNWIQEFAQISTGLSLFPQRGTYWPHDKWLANVNEDLLH